TRRSSSGRSGVRGGNDGADAFAVDDAANVAVGEREDVDRQVIVHAERERRRVHHLQAALDRLQMRQLRQELRIRVDPRVAAVDAFYRMLDHQDRLGVDLERPQGGGRVRGEERVAGTGG